MKDSKKYKPIRNTQEIAKNIIVLDGFSSSGKSLVGSICGYLERSEYWQINDTYERTSVLNYLGEISDDSTSAILKIEVDNHLYNLFIGRNVNFRKTDITSPFYDGRESTYLDRISKKDGDSVIHEIIKKNPIIPLHMHYIFGHSDILFQGFGDKLKLYIVMLRNPFNLIDTWHRQNWVNLICKKERDFHMCCNYNNHVIPWFVVDYANEYQKANDFEKAVLTIYNYYNKVFEMYDKLSESRKTKTMIIVFEKLIVDPNFYVDTMCASLKTKRRNDFDKIMKRLNLPRDLDDSSFLSHDIFIKTYKDQLSEKYIGLLQELEVNYRAFISRFI